MYIVKVMVICIVIWSSTAFGKLNNTKKENKKCTMFYYTSTCLKLDLVRVMAYFGKNTTIPLLSGITILSTERTKKLATELQLNTKSITEEDVDEFLWESAIKYIGSLNITMQLDQSNVLQEIKTFGNDVWSGRGRKGWYAIGTVAAFAFAMMAALTGKAIMASILALFISGMSTLRGGGGGKGGGYDDHYNSPPYSKITQYDIITRPYLSGLYHDHDHHHFNTYNTDTYTSSRQHTGLERKAKEKDS